MERRNQATQSIDPTQAASAGLSMDQRADRLAALSASLPEASREAFASVLASAEVARTMQGEAALVTAHQITEREDRAFGKTMFDKQRFTLDITSAKFEHTHTVANNVLARHGIETASRPKIDALDALRDPEQYLQDVLQNSMGTQSNKGKAWLSAYSRSVEHVNQFVDDVAERAVQTVERELGGVSAGRQLSNHEAEVRQVGIDDFDARFDALVDRLEAATSVQVAQTIGGRMLRGVGLKKHTSQEASTHGQKDWDVKQALKDLSSFVERAERNDGLVSKELDSKVRTRLTELGVSGPSAEDITWVKEHVLNQSKGKVTPERLEGLLDSYVTSTIIPDLEREGLFTSSTQEQPAAHRREQTRAPFEHEVDHEIDQLRNEGLGEREIKRALTKKYHPDTSQDAAAQEKIRYINGLFSRK